MNKEKPLRTERLQLRLTPETKQKLLQLARNEDRTITNYIEHLINQALANKRGDKKMEIKIFANYGVLAAEKRTVYTYGAPHSQAVTSDELTVAVPDGWEYYVTEAGEGVVTAPWGQSYDVNQVLSGDSFPCFRALDNAMHDRVTRLKVKEAPHD